VSGIPGLFNRDGRPVDVDAVGRMIAAAPHRGPDGARCWTSGAVAIAHQQMGSLPEDVPQPIVDAAREAVVAFDGRLDNRPELLGALYAGGPAFRTPSDAELVLAAYARWGDQCPEKLLGDFAFALWDAPRQRLFCARDVMGIKPFYYFSGPRQFAWGSDLRQIAASGAIPSLAPNEAVVAEYLARCVNTQSETLYDGIMRLPPAHCMVVTHDDLRIRRYWRIDPFKEIRCRDDREYAEQFRALLNEAVACRLRSGGGVTAAYLSGGLDSSSVVSIAHAMHRPVETFSLVFPDDPLADERAFIDAVVRRWDVRSHALAPPPISGDVCLAHVARRLDTLDLPADLVSEPMMAEMRQRGVRVALTGVGGDYCLSGTVFHYADLLKSGNVAGFLKQAWADRGVADAGWAWWQPLVSGVRPIIPAAWRRAVRPVAKRLGLVPALPAWIDPAFAARVQLEERLRPSAWTSEAPTFARQRVCELFDSGWTYLLLENGERSAAEYGFEERHPFFDRRLIEFGVALPESQRWTGSRTKYVLREAMRELLPSSVCERNGKGDFRACVAQAVDAIGGGAFFDSVRGIVAAGWIDQAAVSELYARSRRLFDARDEHYCDGMFKLWMIAGIELWYRSAILEGTRHGSIEQTRPAGRPWSIAGAWPEAPSAVPSSRTH
jgi:asparagine synthase (glutamine-hydrolysing)